MSSEDSHKYDDYFNEKSFFSKSTLYWICQIGGWALWGIYLFSFTSEGHTVNDALDTLFTITCMMMLSHYYKLVIVKKGWLKLLFAKLLARTIFSAFLLALINIPITLFLSSLLFNPENIENNLRWVNILSHFIVGTFLFFCWSIVYFLYHYVSSYNKNLKWEALINEFELNQLKSQLNPHFIFNALNTVRALIDEDPHKAKDSVNQISNILRNALMMEKKKVIPFDQELSIVKDYLALESTRYEERLKVTYDIKQGTSNYKVPPMMLQTLVENGIKHGISKYKKGGVIGLRTDIVDDRLHLQIRNTGKYEPKIITREDGGYGLRSTVQRLQLLYNESAFFRIFNEKENMVLTEIVLPQWNEGEPVTAVY